MNATPNINPLSSAMDYKIREGTSHVFRWTAPQPFDATSTPTITFLEPDTGNALLAATPLTPLILNPQAITSIAADNRTLTLTNNLPASAIGMAGPSFGRAFVLSSDDNWFPVEVTRATPSSTTVVLAEALPRDISTSAASILWADFYVQLTNLNVTATAQRNILYQVTYRPRLAGASTIGTDTSAIDEGFVHVVRRPFETGLTTSALRTIFAGMAQMAPSRQQGFEPQIATAFLDLLLMVRANLRELGKWEDDIDGRPLLLAHAYLAAAVIIEVQDSTKAESFRLTAAKHLETAMKGIWLDNNSDGVVDEAEVATHVTGPRTTDVGGTFRTSTRTPSWTRDQSH